MWNRSVKNIPPSLLHVLGNDSQKSYSQEYYDENLIPRDFFNKKCLANKFNSHIFKIHLIIYLKNIKFGVKSKISLK